MKVYTTMEAAQLYDDIQHLRTFAGRCGQRWRNHLFRYWHQGEPLRTVANDDERAALRRLRNKFAKDAFAFTVVRDLDAFVRKDGDRQFVVVDAKTGERIVDRVFSTRTVAVLECRNTNILGEVK